MARSRKHEYRLRTGAVLSGAVLAAMGVTLVAEAAGPAASFAPAVIYQSGALRPETAEVEDVNGDGNLDLITANAFGNNLSVLPGNGVGSFGTAVKFPSGGNRPTDLVVADVSGDGNLDLITANSLSNNLGVLLGNGAGGFAAATTFSTGGLVPRSVAVGDVNGDGFPDLVTANTLSSTLGVLLGNGTGGFASATTFPSGGITPNGVAVADLNADGKADLVAANGNNRLGVLLGNGVGGFAAATVFASGGNAPVAVAVADVNGDGKLDLISANNFSNSLSVLRGNGLGGFTTAVPFSTGGNLPTSVAAADVNGDRILDLIAANSGSNRLAVLLGDGTGSFGAAASFASAGNFPVSVQAADVNGDGKPDLITGHSLSTVAAVLLNTVNYPPVAQPETYNTPRATLVAPAAPGVLANDTDVDGDVLTAVLVTGPTGGSFTLDPNGSFQYTPRLNFIGTDTFVYRAYDGHRTSDPVTVTINVSATPPASTPGAKVDATGTIAVTGGNGSFSLTARQSGGLAQGALVYTESNRNRSVSSTQLISVVLTGRKARIFGKGKLQTGALVDFVADVNDVLEPGRLKDTFQIEISNGLTVGGVLTAGNVSINR